MGRVRLITIAGLNHAVYDNSGNFHALVHVRREMVLVSQRGIDNKFH